MNCEQFFVTFQPLSRVPLPWFPGEDRRWLLKKLQARLLKSSGKQGECEPEADVQKFLGASEHLNRDFFAFMLHFHATSCH